MRCLVSNQVRDLSTVGEQYARLVDALCDISETYYYAGRLDDGLRLLEGGAALLDGPDTPPRDQARLLLQHGKLLAAAYFQGNGAADAAIAPLSRAQQIADSTGDDRLRGAVLDALGLAHYYRALNTGVGDADTALTHFQQALALLSATHDTRGICEALFHVGLAHQVLTKQIDQALEYFTRALQIAEQHDYKYEKSYLVRHLGFIAQSSGDLDLARRYLEESLALREAIGFKAYLPFSHLAVGDVCSEQHDLAAAETHYRHAYRLAEEMDVRAGVVFALISLGDLDLERQEREQARAYFTQAHALAQRSGIQRWIDQTAARLAQFDAET
jgi:tetratricopeptide (TPR) repeat protein